MAEREPREATAGFMQSFWRDERGRTLTGSERGYSDEMSVGGMDGGNSGRRSSAMNCVNWECVRDVK